MQDLDNNIEFNILVSQAVNLALEERNNNIRIGKVPEFNLPAVVQRHVDNILRARQDPEIIKMYTEYKGRLDTKEKHDSNPKSRT
jgi:hypothetical protein